MLAGGTTMPRDTENLSPLAEADRRFELASQFEEAGDYDRALEECNSAIDIARSFLADGYNLQGIILEGLDRPEKALEAYKKALRTEPGLTQAAETISTCSNPSSDSSRSC
jgi:tetratricopeptide (TPR) repeat protein